MPLPQTQPATNAATKRFNDIIGAPATKEYLKKVLNERADTFTTSVTSLVNNSANLQACDPYSIIFCAIKGAALNLALEPSFGFAYVIPYKDNRTGKTLAQFQMGYKGLLQLAMRSGQFKRINTGALHEGELLSSDLLSGDITIETVADRERKPVIGYFAYMRLVNGFEKTLYMTREAVEAHAKRYSQSYRYDRNRTSVWAQNFDLMAEKTVLKLLLSRYAPVSLEMQNAIQDDQKVFDDNDDKGRYADNEDTKAALARMAQAAIDADMAEAEVVPNPEDFPAPVDDPWPEPQPESQVELRQETKVEPAPAAKPQRTPRNRKEAASDGLPFDD